MSAERNFAFFVERVLLMRHFVVVRLAVCVEALPVYSSLSPPIVTRALCFTFLCGRRLATIRGYVTFLSRGTAERGMNRMVFVPLIRVPTPCASLPRSFASAVCQSSFAGVRRRCLYSNEAPVCSSMTELQSKCLCSLGCCTVFACCDRDRSGYR